MVYTVWMSYGVHSVDELWCTLWMSYDVHSVDELWCTSFTKCLCFTFYNKPTEHCNILYTSVSFLCTFSNNNYVFILIEAIYLKPSV